MAKFEANLCAKPPTLNDKTEGQNCVECLVASQKSPTGIPRALPTAVPGEATPAVTSAMNTISDSEKARLVREHAFFKWLLTKYEMGPLAFQAACDVLLEACNFRIQELQRWLDNTNLNLKNAKNMEAETSTAREELNHLAEGKKLSEVGLRIAFLPMAQFNNDAKTDLGLSTSLPEKIQVQFKRETTVAKLKLEKLWL